MSFTSAAHPYGVKPQGNAFFASPSSLKVRANGLGPSFHRLKDETLIDLLSFFSIGDLANMSVTSRGMYVFCHHSDLWRDLVLRTWPKSPVNYIRTWKESYMCAFRKGIDKNGSNSGGSAYGLKSNPLHMPIAVDGIFSGTLYRAWSCHSCDLATACPGFFQFNDIDRVEASDLTVDEFTARYEIPNKPVVVTKAVDHWTALQKWSPAYLASLEKEPQLFRATSATAPLAANFTLEGYFQYAQQSQEEAPLYLFERDFAAKIPALENDYDVPRYFRDDEGSAPSSEEEKEKKTDLFSVLGKDARPDYRWLICGPKKSGSIFHIDPNQTNAWNVSVQGRKKWIFYPPSVPPPGVISSVDGADVTVPICIGEWLLSFWDQHLEERKQADRSLRPLEVIVNPGDVIFVPHGYWHMVINLDDCIALTHNYVSTSNLSDCLRFLRTKPDQVSGVRDRPGEAVEPEQIHDTFVSALERAMNPAVLQAVLAEDGANSGDENKKAGAVSSEAVNSRGRKALKRRREGNPFVSGASKAPVSSSPSSVGAGETDGESGLVGGPQSGGQAFSFSFF